jgi:two-component system, cell cycle sensor histidine kinase and response regulator CckA
MSKNNLHSLHLDSQDHSQTLIRKDDGQDGKHILLVDDNMAHLRSIHNLLIHLNYKVVSTADPHEALKIFHDQWAKFDMIITDQMMPGMKGGELATHVRKIRKDIPVIVCSGSEEALYELQEQGADIQEYILKPFSGAQLAQAIIRIVS